MLNLTWGNWRNNTILECGETKDTKQDENWLLRSFIAQK